MKASSYAAIALLSVVSSVAGAPPGAVNTTGTLCDSEFLIFNDTNVNDLLWCAQHVNYLCWPSGNGSGWFMEYNSTTGPVPAKCNPWEYNIGNDPNVTGSLSLPGIVASPQVVIEGQYPRWGDNFTTIPAVPMNLTSLELPDLVNVGVFQVQYAAKLESLSVPKLTNVSESLLIDLSAEVGYPSPPAIHLSFPSLYQVMGGIDITGNIDSIDFPALNYSMAVNITSTGNLDCVALAASVVNTTAYLWRNPETYSNTSMVCNSKMGNVSTWHALPKSSSERLVVASNLLGLTGFVGFLGLFL